VLFVNPGHGSNSVRLACTYITQSPCFSNTAALYRECRCRLAVGQSAGGSAGCPHWTFITEYLRYLSRRQNHLSSAGFSESCCGLVFFKQQAGAERCECNPAADEQLVCKSTCCSCSAASSSSVTLVVSCNECMPYDVPNCGLFFQVK